MTTQAPSPEPAENFGNRLAELRATSASITGIQDDAEKAMARRSLALECRDLALALKEHLEPLAADHAADVKRILKAIHPDAEDCTSDECAVAFGKAGIAVRLLRDASDLHYNAANTHGRDASGLVPALAEIIDALPSADAESARIKAIAAQAEVIAATEPFPG